jgi:hypothetical protein
VSDWERAIRLLAEGDYGCVLARGEETLVSRAPGVGALVDWLAAGVELAGFAAADRVVGRAAALLYAHAGVVAVYADLAGAAAADICAAHGIAFRAAVTVPGILNRDQTGPCPLEAAVTGVDDPATAVGLLTDTVRTLRGR